MIVGPICQTANEDDARYCGRCGTTLHGVIPGPPPQPAPEPDPVPETAPEPAPLPPAQAWTPPSAPEPVVEPVPEPEAAPTPEPKAASEAAPPPTSSADDSHGDWIALVGGASDAPTPAAPSVPSEVTPPVVSPVIAPLSEAAPSHAGTTDAVGSRYQPTPAAEAPVAPSVPPVTATPGYPPVSRDDAPTPPVTPPVAAPTPTPAAVNATVPPVSPMQEAAPFAAGVAAAAATTGVAAQAAPWPSVPPQSTMSPAAETGPVFDRSKLVPPSPPPDAAEPTYEASEEPPRRGRSLWPLLLVAVVLVGVGGAWLGRDLLGGYNDNAVAASSGDDAAAATSVAGDTDTRTDWQRAYTDNFVSMIPATMVVSSKANVRNYPSTEETQTTAELTEGTMVTGRWVRGKDATTRWLLLDSGGYIWDGNLAQQNGPGSPIDIPITNNNSGFGREIRSYTDQASDAARSTQKPGAVVDGGGEGESSYARVPNRRFHGVTVTGVGQHYESTSIYFRESPETVRRAFREGGLRINSDGSVPMGENADESCTISPARGQGTQYGMTELECGV